MRNQSRSWLYLRVSVAVILAGMLVGLIAESPATATTPPTTSVLIPATGATLSGTATTLDASASNATSVEFWIFGGSYGYSGKMIGTAKQTIYGWVSSWNTTTVPNASYALLSEAFGAGGSAFSAGVSITVNNATVNNASWPQFHYGPDRTGYQPNETKIGVGNVGTLSQVRTYPTNGSPSAPLIANGILYVATGQLYAFDATGATGCSGAPTTCTPLWTAPASQFHGMTIANGVVFVSDAEGVQAYDAAGSTHCSGTPKVCAPLWQTSTSDLSGPGFVPSNVGSPVVANGVLYVPGYGDGLAPNLGGALVAAFDTAGSKGCTVYSGFGTRCVPMWTTAGLPASAGNFGSPTVAGGVLYIANGPLYAFDAAGSTGCSGTPTVCAPLWTGATSGGPDAAPAVADGKVYVGTFYGPLNVFNAAGSTNCTVTGGTKTCTPLWTDASGGTGGTPAIANGVVYTVSWSDTLSAFDAAGSTNCTVSSGIKTCTPLWASASLAVSSANNSSPAVANGVVYFTSYIGGIYGYDAAGSTNCTVSGGIKTCAPVWSAAPGHSGGTSPAIVNGVIYTMSLATVFAVYAYSL